MKAIIVAAGVGSRLGDLTKNLTKSLIPINNVSVLERQITTFQNLGITDITVIIGPHAEKYSFKDIFYLQDTSYLEHDILSSFMLARKIITDDTIVSYGDVLFDENILKPLIDFQGLIGLGIDFDWEKNYDNKNEELKLEATVALTKNNLCIRIIDGREFKKSKNQTIKKILNSQTETLGEFVGLMKLSKEGGKIFKEKYERLIATHSGPFHEAKSLSHAYFTDMLQELIESNIDVTPIPVKGKWCEIDTLQDLKRAEEIFC